MITGKSRTVKRLKKPCRKCGKSFRPTGRVCKLCEECFGIARNWRGVKRT